MASALALLLALPLGSITAAAGGGGSCVTISVTPVGVGVNPECRPLVTLGGYQRSSFQEVAADPSGTDVHVWWSLFEGAREAAGFQVLGGSNPENLSVIGSLGARERSFEDEGALLRGDTLWYAVTVFFADGTTERSSPVMVGAHGASTVRG